MTMNDETARRDRVALLAACLMLCAGLAVAKSVGWLDLPWWLVAAAPILAFAFEFAFHVPAAVLGTFQHHFRRS